jgi:hypothetical protein
VRARVLLVSAAVVAIGAAIVLALLGRAVLTVPDAIRADDARLARPDLAPAAAIGSTAIFAGPAESLLGVGDDQAYREALVLYRASQDTGLSDRDVLSLHGEAGAKLTRIVRTDGDETLRSRAANLLGVLLLEDARLDPTSSRRYLELSLGAFQDAVRLDPDYVEAKHNLELLATLPLDTTFQPREGRGPDASATEPQLGY